MRRVPFICLILSVLPVSGYAKDAPEPSALITLSVANMRKVPDHRSELVSQTIMGTPVAVLREKKGWLLIRTPDGYKGWTEPSSLAIMDAAGMEAWRKAPRVMYAGTAGWIKGPDRQSGISDVTGGAILVKGEESGGWTTVVLPDGRTGFVETNLLKDFNLVPNVIPVSAEALIRTAREYIGIPYLWGGASAKAADCSGFMQSVFFRNGIVLMRDASQQATQGNRIGTGQGLDVLQPGDLLFFGSPVTGNITHVALYIGNMEYIHASGRVFIASLDPACANYSAYRRNSLRFAVRLTGKDTQLNVSAHPWY
jgi:SH3-like domain-containing protein